MRAKTLSFMILGLFILAVFPQAQAGDPEWKELERKSLTPEQIKVLATLNGLYASTEGPQKAAVAEVFRLPDDQDEVAYAFLEGAVGTERERNKNHIKALSRLSKVLFSEDIFRKSYDEEDIRVTTAVSELLEVNSGALRDAQFRELGYLNGALEVFDSRKLDVKLVRVTLTGTDPEWSGGYQKIYRFLLIPVVRPADLEYFPSRAGATLRSKFLVVGLSTEYRE